MRAKTMTCEGRPLAHEFDVAALFVRADSVYKTMAGVYCYDIERDARLWPGGMPLVAHPPCRAWGRLRHMSKPRDDEKALAPWAVDQVRRWGGVLEHPARSSLWPALGLPRPGDAPDQFGGWATGIHQFDFGHRAEKATWLYIVGCAPGELPDTPIVIGEAPCTISTSGRRRDGSRSKRRPEVAKAEREHSPPDLAAWLVEVARRCKRHTIAP